MPPLPVRGRRILVRKPHCRLVAACNVHAAIAQDLTDPGALSPCALCEDLTGTAEPTTLPSVEPWNPEHPAITDAERTRRPPGRRGYLAAASGPRSPGTTR